MTKNKLAKIVVIVMFFIPIILFTIAIIQTFLLKSKQAKLQKLQTSLQQDQEYYDDLKKQEEYISSDKYEEEYFKYEYGSDGDSVIIVKPNNNIK